MEATRKSVDSLIVQCEDYLKKEATEIIATTLAEKIDSIFDNARKLNEELKKGSATLLTGVDFNGKELRAAHQADADFCIGLSASLPYQNLQSEREKVIATAEARENAKYKVSFLKLEAGNVALELTPPTVSAELFPLDDLDSKDIEGLTLFGSSDTRSEYSNEEEQQSTLGSSAGSRFRMAALGATLVAITAIYNM